MFFCEETSKKYVAVKKRPFNKNIDANCDVLSSTNFIPVFDAIFDIRFFYLKKKSIEAFCQKSWFFSFVYVNLNINV